MPNPTISQITLPDGTTYDIKDPNATTTAVSANTSTHPLVITTDIQDGDGVDY